MKKVAWLLKTIGNNIDLILIIIGLIVLDITIATKSIFLSGIFAGIELLVLGITIAILSNIKH
ncbi:hypothetical protein [Ligilactobacillus sp. 110_WCHN]|uniref:hypothetical protein n=1 Tax=Ligilactobacillus sp. 110_WCHN TaxID=3057125 RepID=UPI002672062C|nr:hypothetical protein [Ligilactobacillus sp. 110_WCHN]MDO3394019.1 hypothetical protein [Ligilactobacillus sp. 110_WCHN]